MYRKMLPTGIIEDTGVPVIEHLYHPLPNEVIENAVGVDESATAVPPDKSKMTPTPPPPVQLAPLLRAMRIFVRSAALANTLSVTAVVVAPPDDVWVTLCSAVVAVSSNFCADVAPLGAAIEDPTVMALSVQVALKFSLCTSKFVLCSSTNSPRLSPVVGLWSKRGEFAGTNSNKPLGRIRVAELVLVKVILGSNVRELAKFNDKEGTILGKF